MFSCKFNIPSSILAHFNAFIDENELSNISIFENTDLGFSNALDEFGFPIANFFNVEIFMESKMPKNIDALINKFASYIENIYIQEIQEQDWVDQYTKNLTPVICDNFYFYNSDIQTPPADQDLIPIKLHSALAFGSGHHQTTQGCILAMRFLDNLKFTPKKILDMGCGTGILGICSKKIWKNADVLGIDIDRDAVSISNENFRINGMDAVAIEGSSPKNLENLPYTDLILCNILKQPLIDFANTFSRLICNSGFIIASGFIKTQEYEVINAYRVYNFSVKHVIYIEDWVAIIFEKMQ